MCYILDDCNDIIYSTNVIVEYSRFDNKNTVFEIFICFDDSVGFARCYFNNVSFNCYYIGIEQHQSDDMTNTICRSFWFPISIINKNNKISTLLEIYDSNFNQENNAKLIIVDFNIGQSNWITSIENDIMNDLNTLQFSRHSSKLMKIFHDYFITSNIQNNVFNTPFIQHIFYGTNKLNHTHTKLTIDNITYDFNADGTLNLTYIELYSHIFNHCKRWTTIWKSTVNEYNDLNGNLINNIFCISVLNTITGTVASDAEIILSITNYSFKYYINYDAFHNGNGDNNNASYSDKYNGYDVYNIHTNVESSNMNNCRKSTSLITIVGKTKTIKDNLELTSIILNYSIITDKATDDLIQLCFEGTQIRISRINNGFINIVYTHHDIKNHEFDNHIVIIEPTNSGHIKSMLQHNNNKVFVFIHVQIIAPVGQRDDDGNNDNGNGDKCQ